MRIDTPVSCGELIDKLTILQIKKLKIKDKAKLQQIGKEYDYLQKIYSKLLQKYTDLEKFFDKLFKINSDLWEIEDKIRICEKNNKFDNHFINLARSVYQTNDLRFKIKNEINEYLNSDIKEQKSYKEY